MTDKNAEQIVRQFDSLAAQRSNWESHWQEVGDYIIPRKADITKARSGGDKRSELVFDGTALHAAELLSASLHGMLTNSSTAWFFFFTLFVMQSLMEMMKQKNGCNL